MLVAHCPGHGIMKTNDLDHGCAHNGLIESELVLDLCVRLVNVIPICEHRLLRVDDIGQDYTQRGRRAKEMNADLVVCHHVNAHTSGASHGLLAFYSDAVGQAAAEAIERAAPQALRRKSDSSIEAVPGEWTRNAYWVMNHYSRHGIPTVLIEWGFATNEDDAKYLLDAKSLPAIAACLMAGVARAMEVLPKKGN